MAKSAPFSIRLSAEVEALISEEAERTQRSKGWVIEELATEALKTRLFPGIAFRSAHSGRRAWMMGTGLDVWQIIDAYRDFGSVERMAAESDLLSERQIRLALAYYERFPDEIDPHVERNRRPLEVLHAQYPEFEVVLISDD